MHSLGAIGVFEDAESIFAIKITNPATKIATPAILLWPDSGEMVGKTPNHRTFRLIL